MFGGAVGSLARYYLSGWPHKDADWIFPWGTMLVNTTGAFIIGILWGLVDNMNFSPNTRTFIFIGILGGFTTFSTYALETLNLFRDGNFKLALLNIVMSNVLAIFLVFAGFLLARGGIELLK